MKHDGVKVQNVDFDSVNNAQHNTSGKMSNKSDKLSKDSDNSTKPLQITQDHKQTNKHKRTTKIPLTRSDDFLWTYYTIQKSQCVHLRITCASTSEF